MRRREFITLLGGAAAAWPLAARAQQPRVPVIGLLSGFSAAAPIAGFHQGLKEIGFVEGQNVAFEYHFADGQYDRLPTWAAELVSKRVNIIATIGENAAKVAQEAAVGAIPIVFSLGDDPVTLGLVASFNRPGSNITGSTSIGHTLGPKRVELLRELVPNATVIALLTNPKQPREFERRDVEEKTRALGWQLRQLTASSIDEFDAAFTTLVNERIGGLIIANETFFFSQIGTNRTRLAILAAGIRLPTIHPNRENIDAGGLMSYGPNLPDLHRRAADFVDRILRGAKPADLPVDRATKFELVINLKTAKTLGLEIPPTLLARADEVIE